MKPYQWLDDGIKNIINTFEYDMFVVAVDYARDCTCKNFTTKQGEADCKLCLGTGQKIKIRNIRGASQESSSSFRSQGVDEKSLANIYYIKAEYHINERDLLVDGDAVVIANRIERKKGTQREYVYQKCLCIPKKADVQVFLKNFYDIVGE